VCVCVISLDKQVNHNAAKINRIWHLSLTIITTKQNLSQDLRKQTIKNTNMSTTMYRTQNVGTFLIKTNSVHAYKQIDN